MASTSWPEEYARLTVLTRDGSRFNGVYDGYGRVVSADGSIHELNDQAIRCGEIKLVLTRFYKNEPFERLDKTYDDPGQGHFHDSKDLEKWYAKGGFKSHKAYVKAYNAN